MKFDFDKELCKPKVGDIVINDSREGRVHIICEHKEDAVNGTFYSVFRLDTFIYVPHLFDSVEDLLGRYFKGENIRVIPSEQVAFGVIKN